MSQYPSPYSPPQLPYANAPLPGGPRPHGLARKAAILLFVLGGFGIAMGLCAGSLVWVIPDQQMAPFVDQVLQHRKIEMNGMSPERFVRFLYTLVGFISLVLGGVMLLLGGFVRRASKGATISAAILCGLGTLYFTLEVFGCAAMALRGDIKFVFGGCIVLAPLSLFGLATLWLVQLLRELPAIQAAQRQYQSQYNQSQQQQWRYNSHQPGGVVGYGGYPPPGGSGQMPVAPPSGQGYALPPQVPPSSVPGQNPTPELPKSESPLNDKMPE